MSESIARYYRPDKNPNGAGFPGVPLRDLTEQEFAALPEHVQRDVDASDVYQKTKPRVQIVETPEPVTAPEQEAT